MRKFYSDDKESFLDFVAKIVGCFFVGSMIAYFYIGNWRTIEEPKKPANVCSVDSVEQTGIVSMFIQDPLCPENDTVTIGCGGSFRSVSDYWLYVSDLGSSLTGDVTFIQVSDVPCECMELPEEFWDKTNVKSVTYQNFFIDGDTCKMVENFWKQFVEEKPITDSTKTGIYTIGSYGDFISAPDFYPYIQENDTCMRILEK